MSLSLAFTNLVIQLTSHFRTRSVSVIAHIRKANSTRSYSYGRQATISKPVEADSVQNTQVTKMQDDPSVCKLDIRHNPCGLNEKYVYVMYLGFRYKLKRPTTILPALYHINTLGYSQRSVIVT